MRAAKCDNRGNCKGDFLFSFVSFLFFLIFPYFSLFFRVLFLLLQGFISFFCFSPSFSHVFVIFPTLMSLPYVPLSNYYIIITSFPYIQIFPCYITMAYT